MQNIHEVIKSLIQEGFTERQAETMAASFYHHNGNATKEDVVQIRADMATKDDVKNMATKDDVKNMATKDDIQNAEKRMANDNKLTRWIIGVILITIGIVLTIIQLR